jgi:hypothetical protein
MFERVITKEEDLTRVEADMVLVAMKTNQFERRTCCGRPIKTK